MRAEEGNGAGLACENNAGSGVQRMRAGRTSMSLPRSSGPQPASQLPSAASARVFARAHTSSFILIFPNAPDCRSRSVCTVSSLMARRRQKRCTRTRALF